MRKYTYMVGSRTAAALMLAGLLLFSANSVWAQSGEAPKRKLGSLMHVFSYTPIPTATPADFAAFEKATQEMVGKIPGLRKVWAGKLMRPLKLGEVQREYGVAMEFDDEAALTVYATHPAHEVWVRAYEKVRVEGTTTIDILVE